MSWFFKKIRTMLGVQYSLMLEYRAEIFLWVLVGILPFILMGVWMKVAAQGQSGFSEPEFARYFLAVFIVRQFTIVWVAYDLEWLVSQGRLSPLLLRPMDPVWQFVSGHLGEQLTRLPFWIIIVGLFCVLYPQAIHPIPSLQTLVLTLIAIATAFIVRFVMQYTFALVAFWVERASAIEQLSYVPYLFLAGMVAPLEMFPPAVRTIAEYTPYPYMLYFPASILIGRAQNIGHSFMILGIWFVIFLVLNRLMWRAGLKHYSGMGA